MTNIIDRRGQPDNKSVVNRGRFLDRYKRQLREAVSDAIGNRSIKDIEKGATVPIPTGDIDSPGIGHAKDGIWERVIPGNDNYLTGDKFRRPSGGEGRGNGASDSDELFDDEFTFQLTKDEFMDIFFEDLELPDLVKEDLNQVKDFSTVRSGFKTDGTASNLSILRTLKQSIGRKMSSSTPNRKRLEELEAELAELDEGDPAASELHIQISDLKKKIAAAIFLDPIDLRYRNYTQIVNPSKTAVMFAIMDVSGSMGQFEKDIAKRYFILLYLFLTRRYENIEVVFIKHHTQAFEVEEEDFFYSRESGGTTVSSALELTRDIIKQRFPPDKYNIYASQASDGDNWEGDSPECGRLLVEEILPLVQFYSYIEISRGSQTQNLWDAYKHVERKCPNFAMDVVTQARDIYGVFKYFFAKRS